MARVRYIDKVFLVHSLTPDYIYMLIQAKTYTDLGLQSIYTNNACYDEPLYREREGMFSSLIQGRKWFLKFLPLAVFALRSFLVLSFHVKVAKKRLFGNQEILIQVFHSDCWQCDLKEH